MLGTNQSNTITTNKGILQLTSSVLPSNATNKTVIWSLLNGTGQASINSSGLVTAISNGTVTARATSTDGSGVLGIIIITISNQENVEYTLYMNSAIENATPSIIEMNYSLALANIIPSTSAFSVQVNSAARSVSSVSISGTKVLLTLSSPVAYGNIVTVAYTKPSTNPLQTPAGGQAANLSEQNVTNRIAAPPPPPTVPAFSGAAVENAAPSVIVVTFNLDLASIIPAVSAFSVTVNTAAITVSSVSVSGTTVSLTLSSPVYMGTL